MAFLPTSPGHGLTGEQEKALDIAVGLTNQLITLSTAVATVVIGIFGLVKPISAGTVWYLIAAVILELASVLSGLILHGNIAYILADEKRIPDIYEPRLRVLAISQWSTFLIGLIVLVVSLFTLIGVSV